MSQLFNLEGNSFTDALIEHIDNNQKKISMPKFNEHNVPLPQYNKTEFKTQYNSLPSIGEINIEPSMTIPDQSLSITELLKRAARGLPIGDSRTPLYDGEDDLLQGVDLRSLDIAERYDFMRSTAEELMQIRTNIAKEKQEKHLLDLENKVREKIKMETKPTDVSSE